MMQLAMHQVSGAEIKKVNGSFLNATQTAPLNQATPPCMENLEMLMSVERDEWMSTKEDSLSGLFMPFANLHTGTSFAHRLSFYDQLEQELAEAGTVDSGRIW